MKVIYTDLEGQSLDISDLVGELTLSGDDEQVSRTLDFPLLRPDVDYYMPKVHMKLGGNITIYDDEDKEVFSGTIWFKDFNDNDITQKITCYDMALYTNKSEPETFVFKDMTCGEIAKTVLGELGLPIGEVEDGEVITLNGRGKTAYEIIMAAYTKDSQKTGKKYHMVVEDGKISLVEKDKRVETLVEYREEAAPGTIISVSYEESIDNMVNKVKVINDKKKDQKEDGAEKNEEIENFGLVQKIIYGQVEDSQGILKGARTNISLECFGDFSFVSGKSVTIKTRQVEGDFYIKSDNHTINDGIHKVKMELTNEQTMKEVELGE